MKAHNIDYVKELYLEGIQFMQDKVTDVLLKNQTLASQITKRNTITDLAKLCTTPQILREGSSNFKCNTIPQPGYEAPITTQFGYVSPIQPQYP